MAQVHKAGAVSSCSNEVAGHNELEEFSQRNSFAYFCFGFLCKCFFSALVDGFQTEGTLGNEREKAVTHCTRCQGMAVTHGSWRGPRGAPRQRCCAEPPSPGPCRPRPGCPSAPAAALGRCLPAPAAASPLTPKAGGDHRPLHASHRGDTGQGHAKRTGDSACGTSRDLPLKGRNAGRQESCLDLAAAQHSLFPGPTARCGAQHGLEAQGQARSRRVRGGGGVTGPRCRLKGSIPSAAPYELLPAATARCSWKGGREV